MKTSESVSKIAGALVKAQRVMGAAKKDAKNPFFKSKYADLGAVLEACKDALNENGVSILQPHDGLSVVTVLMHESGEWISSSTPIVCAKQNDPQALGSAITYARRYGLQSIVSLPAEDDDGEAGMGRKSAPVKQEAPKAEAAPQAPAPQVAQPAPVNMHTEAPKKTSTFSKPKAAPAPAAAPVTTADQNELDWG